jgi:eukaryotic-like serine/threonine-protein kinase
MTTYANTGSVARDVRRPRETLTMSAAFGRGIPALASYELSGESVTEGGVRSEYAQHRFLDRSVVVRRLMPTTVGRAQRYYTFLQEIHAQAMLRHPLIAQVFDAGIHEEHPYAVLEQPRGTPLDEQVAWLAERGMRMDTREALRAVASVAELVEHAHRHGVRVSNLTPSNIVLSDAGAPTAHSTGAPEAAEALRESEQRLAFSAPELLTGALSDHRSEIYALGALLYYTLSGRALFSGPAESVLAQKQSGHIPALAGMPSDVDSVALEHIIRRATARRLADRYADVSELRQDLEALLAREFGAPSPVTVQPRHAPRALPQAPSRPTPLRAPAPPLSAAAAEGWVLEDPSHVPGAEREELRAALPYTILVPLPEAPALDSATARALDVAQSAAASSPGAVTWISVFIVVAIALGAALMLG